MYSIVSDMCVMSDNNDCVFITKMTILLCCYMSPFQYSMIIENSQYSMIIELADSKL